MSEEFKEYGEELVKKVVEEFEEIIDFTVDKVVERREFLRGIALGLFYGIVGNLFVQHWYPVFEGIVLRTFDEIFWANLIIFVVALSLIAIATAKLYSTMKQYKTSLDELADQRKKLTDMKLKRDMKKLAEKQLKALNEAYPTKDESK